MKSMLKFLKENDKGIITDGRTDKQILDYMEAYRSNGWLLEIWQKDEIIAICTWKETDNIFELDIIDLVVRKDHRRNWNTLIQGMTLSYVKKHPFVKSLKFYRHGDESKTYKTIDLNRWLRLVNSKEKENV